MNDQSPLTSHEHLEILKKYRPSHNISDGWHTISDDGYLYDHLAYHLKEAGLTDSLKALFATQDWMQVRVRQSGYTYDKYLADLELAWQVAVHQALRQIENDEDPQAFADCIRCALIRGQVTDQSRLYPPELVARAVVLGIWSADRAISIAAKNEHMKTELAAAILSTGRLNPEQYSRLQTEGFEYALWLRDYGYEIFATDAHYLFAVARLAPYLTQEQRAELLKISVESFWGQGWGNVHWSDEPLAALAPYFTASQVQSVAEAVEKSYVWRSMGAQVLSILIPYLPKAEQLSAVEKVFQHIKTHDNPWSNPGSLARLLSFMEGEQKQTALKLGLEFAVKAQIPRDRVGALILLIQHVSDDEQAAYIEDVLGLTLQLESEWDRVHRLIDLFPHLNEQQRQGVLPIILKIDLTSGDNLARIVKIFPYLMDAQREEALERAFNEVISFPEQFQRMTMLGQVAPYMNENQVLQSLLVCVATPNANTMASTQAVVNLIPLMAESKRFYWIQQVFASPYKSRYLASLLPFLSEHDSQQALDALYSQKLTPSALARELAGLVPGLKGDAQRRGVRLAFQALVEEFRQGTISINLAHESNRRFLGTWTANVYADIITQIGPYLDDEEAPKRLYDIVMQSPNKGTRANALITLIPKLDKDRRDKAVSYVFDLAFKDPFRPQGIEQRYLAALLPHLSRSQMLTALRTAFECQNTITSIYIMKMIAPYLETSKKGDILQAAFQLVMKLSTSSHLRAQALTALAPLLPDDLRKRAIQQSYDDLINNKVPSEAYLDDIWLKCFAKLIPMLSDSSYVRKEVRSTLLKYIAKRQKEGNAVILGLCYQFRELGTTIFSTDIYEQIAGHIADICENWQWI